MPVKEAAPWDEGPLAAHRIKTLNFHNLTTDERIWLGKLMHTDGVKATELVKFYGLPRKWLNKLSKKARDNKVICDTKGKGRPFYLTSESCILLKQYLVEKHRTRAATEDEFKAKCQLLYNDQCFASGLAPVQQIKLSRTFMKKMQKSVKLKLGPGQGKTKARFDAEKDPRNAYSEYISLRCLKEDIDPNLICNIDATQYGLDKDGSIKKLVWVEGNNGPANYQTDGELLLFAKVYMCGTESGICSSMVVVFAIDDMEPDDFISVKIPGMSHVPAAGQYGYVCFTKTRGCNKKFYDWYYTNVVIPFLNQQRLDNNLGRKNEYGQWDPEFTSRALVTMDGEAIQINSVFSEEVRVLLELNLIDVGKHCASSSASTNAWDACSFFKANKKAMKSTSLINEVTAKGKYAIGRVIETNLTECIGNLCDVPKREKIADALLRIIVSSQKTLNLSSIVNGFQLTGQNPLNFAVKMNASYKGPTLSAAEWNHMQSDLVINYLTKMFKLQGHIKERDFDAMNIKRVHDDRAADKDERVLHQQRFVLLTHDNTNDRWETHKRNIDNRAIPRTEMAKLKRKQTEDAKAKIKEDKLQEKRQKQLNKQAQIELQQKQKNDREEQKRLKSEEERQEKNKRKAIAKVVDDDNTKIKKSRPKSSSSSSEIIMDEDNSNVQSTEEIDKFSSNGRILKKKRLD